MTYQVTIEPTGDIVEVEEGQTILDASLRQGVWLPFACGHGTCATCKCQLLEGEVEIGNASPFALMDVERDEGKILVCCAVPESDLVIEADIDADPDFLGYAIEDFQATVVGIDELSPTIKGIRFELDHPMRFQAGQYINLNMPSVEGARAFSIANTPSDSGVLELHVRRVPEGAGTAYVHEQLKVGDTLDLSGPYGQFFTRISAPEDLIFIAGGSGLSSPQSMVLELLEQGDTRKILCCRERVTSRSCTTVSCLNVWNASTTISPMCPPWTHRCQRTIGPASVATYTRRQLNTLKVCFPGTRPICVVRRR